MDAYTTQALVDLGSSLAVLAAKGTASAVCDGSVPNVGVELGSRG